MKVWLNDGTTPKPEDAFFYELASNGLFIHKDMPFWKAVVPVDKISALEERSPELELKITKIPGDIAKDVIRFFAWIYKKQHTEVAALLWFNGETKKYRVSIPKQTVSYSSIKYDIAEELKAGAESGVSLVGTFHSHSGMGAFHSCVDKKDEEALDGIHFTFGDFSDSKDAKEISMSLEAAINGTRFKLNPADYLEGIDAPGVKKDPFTTPEKREVFYKKWGHVSGFGYDSSSNKFAISGGEPILPEDYKPNSDWDEKVVKESWGGIGEYSRSILGFGAKKDEPLGEGSSKESAGDGTYGDDFIYIDSHPGKVVLDNVDREDFYGKGKHRKRKHKHGKKDKDGK